MNWVNLAILSAITFGIVSILDSHIISKRMPGLRAFLLPVGIIILVYGLVLLYVFPLPGEISLWTLLLALASGILRTASVLVMLYVLKREEVSRVIPVVYSYPIFVAIMAMPLLGERLDYLEWMAIVIVVAGAIMISIRRSLSGSTIWLSKSFLILVGSSLLLALGDLTSKYVLAYISPWNLLQVNALSMSAIFLLISVNSRTLKELAVLPHKKISLGLVVLNETIAMTAIVMFLWALNSGPVSLVSIVVGSRPFFVVIFALVISQVWPAFLDWHPGRGMLALRLIATVMIVSGITIIHLL